MATPEQPPDSREVVVPPGMPQDQRLALKEMLEKARTGDRSVVPLLREFMRVPGMVEVLGGNIAEEAVQLMVRTFAGTDLVTREALYRKLADLRQALGRERANPSVAEGLLIERVAATWLHLHYQEMHYACQENMSELRNLYYQRIISTAQQRDFAALELLRDQRKVLPPSVQINVANEQVNVASNASPAPMG